MHYMKDIVTQLHLQAASHDYTPTPGNIASGTYYAGALLGKQIIEYILKQDQKTLELRVGDTIAYFAWTGSQWARQGGVTGYFTSENLATAALTGTIKPLTEKS